MIRVFQQVAHFFTHRGQRFNRQVRQRRLKITKSATAKFRQHRIDRRVSERRVDANKIFCFRAIFKASRLGGQRVRIRLGLADLLCNLIPIICQIDPGVVRSVRFAHLCRSVPQTHDTRGRAKDLRFGQGEEIHFVCLIKGLCDIAGQFEMLFLVLANRHMGRPIGQNIGRHQDGVGV